MPSAFSKEERVLFDDVVAKFEDGEIMAKAVRKSNYTADMKAMERQNNIIYRRVPYILKGNALQDQTGQFGGVTQMSVPVSLSQRAAQPIRLEQNEIRDMDQLQWLSEAAINEIGSQINIAVTNAICNLGSIVIKQTSAPTGFSDLSLANARMTQRGIVGARRVAGIEPDHYRQMAADLAQRQVLQSGKTLTAYEEAYVGKIATFDTLQLEYSKLIPAKTATATLTSATSHYIPKATSVASTDEVSNVDNRFQTIGVTVSAGSIQVGDCFTIANMFSVHNITKQSTGQPMTHRVTAIVSGGGGTGTIQITPPIINRGGGTVAEKQYQNCTGTLAAGAAITFLNTAASNALPFFDERCIELLPGQLPVNETGSGLAQMKYTTKSGVSILLSKQSDIETRGTKYLWETFFGVGVLNTEMCGIILFNQV